MEGDLTNKDDPKLKQSRKWKGMKIFKESMPMLELDTAPALFRIYSIFNLYASWVLR